MNLWITIANLRKILVGDTRLPRWGQTRPSLGTHEGVVGDTREIGLFEETQRFVPIRRLNGACVEHRVEQMVGTVGSPAIAFGIRVGIGVCLPIGRGHIDETGSAVCFGSLGCVEVNAVLA